MLPLLLAVLLVQAPDIESDVPPAVRELDPEASVVDTPPEIETGVRAPQPYVRVLRVNETYLVELPDGTWKTARPHWDGSGKLWASFGDGESLDDLLGDLVAREETGPVAVEGWAIESVWSTDSRPTRIVASRDGETLLVLGRNGDVHRLDPTTGQAEMILDGRSYAYADGPESINRAAQDGALGLAEDETGRLWITVNTILPDERPVGHRVTIFRTAGDQNARPWLTVSYPAGVGAYGHGVGDLVFGPDGMLYVASGSRTDADEAGFDPDFSTEGEVPLTSAIWRIDPTLSSPGEADITIFADGLRNPFGLAFDTDGRLIATESGPDANPPEELNVIVEGGHYGFPYRFSDWPINPYPHVADPPEGLSFIDPVINVGPDGIGPQGRPMASLDPHSSPVGIDPVAFLDDQTFAVARFGNGIMLEQIRVGRDVILIRFIEPDDAGRDRVETTVIATGLPSPIDVATLGESIYVADYGGAVYRITRTD
jgi:glucose/arabinose dehydrogenase